MDIFELLDKMLLPIVLMYLNDCKEHDRGIIGNVNTSFEDKRSQEPLTARKDN